MKNRVYVLMLLAGLTGFVAGRLRMMSEIDSLVLEVDCLTERRDVNGRILHLLMENMRAGKLEETDRDAIFSLAERGDNSVCGKTGSGYSGVARAYEMLFQRRQTRNGHTAHGSLPKEISDIKDDVMILLTRLEEAQSVHGPEKQE